MENTKSSSRWVPVFFLIVFLLSSLISYGLIQQLNFLFFSTLPPVLAVILNVVCYLSLESFFLVYLLPRGRCTKKIGIFANVMLAFYLLYFMLTCVEQIVLWISLRVVGLNWGEAQIWWLGFISFILSVLLSIRGIYNVCKTPTVKEYSIEIPKKSTEKSIRMILLSDLHLGFWNQTTRLAKIVEQTNTLSPDYILIAGDFFNSNCKELYDKENLCELFQSFCAPVYGCLGNHDSGKDFDEMIEFLNQSGVTILMDRCTWLPEGICLVGWKDHKPLGYQGGQRNSLTSFLPENREDIPVVLLNHTPLDYEEVCQAGVDLMVSGHTHGGQFFPVSLVTKLSFPKDKGYNRYQSLQTVICSGTDVFFPCMRFGSYDEISVLNLKFL